MFQMVFHLFKCKFVVCVFLLKLQLSEWGEGKLLLSAISPVEVYKQLHTLTVAVLYTFGAPVWL